MTGEEGEGKPSGGPSFFSVTAALAGEPYHLSLSQIADLTDRQINEIYFHKRDRSGSLITEQSERDEFDQTAELVRLFGTPEQVEKLRHERRKRLGIVKDERDGG